MKSRLHQLMIGWLIGLHTTIEGTTFPQLLLGLNTDKKENKWQKQR
jgi:hypothetical protein